MHSLIVTCTYVCVVCNCVCVAWVCVDVYRMRTYVHIYMCILCTSLKSTVQLTCFKISTIVKPFHALYWRCSEDLSWMQKIFTTTAEFYELASYQATYKLMPYRFPLYSYIDWRNVSKVSCSYKETAIDVEPARDFWSHCCPHMHAHTHTHTHIHIHTYTNTHTYTHTHIHTHTQCYTSILHL